MTLEPKILVVDDEPDVLTSMQDMLADLPGSTVELAETYREGRKLASKGGWTMAIVDEWLPDGKGVNILAELRREHPETIRVMMSAHEDFEDILQGVNSADIDHFIQKPWDPAALRLWVTKRLEPADPPPLGEGRIPMWPRLV
ncbi:MAG TPA: response regulator [Candidatus Thermoplasmatota archaeon]|jgi:DNA-binding NtrC family response regulator|nr:response regulator [Candidatus Thermoplasmatota archaeon]